MAVVIQGNWRLLIAIIAVLGIVSTTFAQMDSEAMMGEELGSLTTVAEVELFLDQIRRATKVENAKNFAQKIRHFKRELDINGVEITSVEKMGLTSIIDQHVQAGTFTGYKYFSHKKRHFIFLAQNSKHQQFLVEIVPPGINSGNANIKMELRAKFKIQAAFPRDMNRIAAHVFEGEIWLALANGDNDLIHTMSIYWQDSTVQDQMWASTAPQTATSMGFPGDMAFFDAQGRLGRTLYLVVGNQYFISKSNTKITSWLFTLRSGYFDIREDKGMNTQGVTSLTTFHADGNIIIVFGCESRVGSVVYIFNPLLNDMRLMNWYLPSTSVTSVQHFSDTQEDREMIIITNKDKGPEIYWWTGEQMELWQEIDQTMTSGSIISSLKVDPLEDIVAFTNGNSIELYVDDLSAHFIQGFSYTTTCTGSIFYLQLLHDIDTDNDFIISSCGQNIDIFQIIHQEIKLVSEPEKADELISCMYELEEHLEERKVDIAYLELILKDDLIMTTDHDQIWIGPITFLDAVTVEEETQFSSQVTVQQSMSSEVVERSLPELVAQLEILRNRSDDLYVLLDNVLTINGEQTIYSAEITNSMVADLAIFNKLNIDILNDVPMNNMASYFLMHDIDQTISAKVDFTTLEVETFSTRGLFIGTINDMYTSDLMRKSVRTQIVTGHHVYGNIHMDGHIHSPSGPEFPIIVNGVSSDSWIMEGSDVTFTGPCSFSNLAVTTALNTPTVNKVSVKDLFARAIFTDDLNNQIMGNLTIQGDLIVEGNIDVPDVNGIDIVALDLNSVKKTGDFVIQGSVEYNNDFTVNHDLTVVRVNDILWSDIIDRDSDTVITSVFTFGMVDVTGDIICDDINGIDISEEAVFITGDQTIEGRVIFETDVTVENQVFMEEFAEINGVDPSDLKNGMDGSGVVFIDKDIVVEGSLSVKGNVSARIVNDIVLTGFEDNYWRKTKDQKILFNTQMPSASFNSELTVGTLNGIKTSDYLHTIGDQIVTGQYIFDDTVTIKGDLVMADFKTIDGVDVSELELDIVTLDGDQTLTGFNIFNGHVDVMQNLVVTGTINDISIPDDVMRVDVENIHTGSLTFTGNIFVTNLELEHDVTVGSVNGYDLSMIVADTVYKNEDITIYGVGISFLNEIVVTENLEVTGLIDGIDFSDFVSRALKKNSDVTQYVTGHIIVDGSAYFGGGLNLKTVNELDWDIHLNSVVDVNYSGLITGNKTFTELIVVKGDLITDSINQINLSVLESKILSKTKEQIITAKYNFTDGIQVGSIDSRYIDEVDCDRLLRTDQDATFPGLVTFHDEITISQGLFAPHNILDGCNLDRLDRSRVWSVDDTDGSLKMPSDIVIGTLTVHGNVYTRGEGKVIIGDEVDLDYFLRNLVTETGDHTITGAVNFLGDVTIADMTAEYLGGIEVDDFLYNSVRKSITRTIKSDLVFENVVKVEHLNVNFDIEKREDDDFMTVNGINIFEMNKNVVRRTDDTIVLTGTKTFLNGLVVNRLTTDYIGDIPVTDFVLLNTDKIISNVSFSVPITIEGNLQVNGLVDGVDLDYLLNNRVTIDGNQELTGDITFKDITIEGDLDIDYINDILLSDLVLRTGQDVQIITGEKTIKGGVTVTGSMQTNSTINEVDISHLDATIVRKNQPTVLQQQIVFEKTVYAESSIVFNGTINDWYIEDLPAALIRLNESIALEAITIKNMLPQIDACNAKNYLYAQGLFEELSYVQRMSFTRLDEAEFVRYVDNFVYVTVQTDKSCLIYDTCFCSRRTYTYKLVDGTLVRTNPGNPNSEPLEIEGSYYPVTHPNDPNIQFSFTTLCNNGQAYTEMRYGNRQMEIIVAKELNEAVDQIERFVYNGVIYFVMVTPQEDGDKVVIMSYDEDGSRYINQPILTKMHGLSISITEFESNVYLLITGHLNIKSAFKKFVTNSLIFTWNGPLQQFEQMSNVRGSHVTSGKLVTVSDPNPVVFLVLSQLKNADTDHFHSNYKYNKPALIFKHTSGSGFVEYEALEDIMGATSLTYFRVDKDLHLCFTVPKDNAMYVYKYVPMEGFILQQKATLSSPSSVISMEVHEGGRSGRKTGYLAVTSYEGIYIFKMKNKGVNPKELFADGGELLYRGDRKSVV